jgi:hypothetical protein
MSIQGNWRIVEMREYEFPNMIDGTFEGQLLGRR